MMLVRARLGTSVLSRVMGGRRTAVLGINARIDRVQHGHGDLGGGVCCLSSDNHTPAPKDPEKREPGEKKAQMQSAAATAGKHGALFFGTNLVLKLGWVGGVYLAIKAGVDVEQGLIDLLYRAGDDYDIVVRCREKLEELKSGSGDSTGMMNSLGSWVAAWAVVEILKPVRWGVTLLIYPYVHRIAKRMGARYGWKL